MLLDAVAQPISEARKDTVSTEPFPCCQTVCAIAASDISIDREGQTGSADRTGIHMTAPSGGFIWNWLRSSARILHRLWLEITGFLFLSLAVFGGFSLFKEWGVYPSEGETWKVAAAGSFTVVMVVFGVYSFYKAHRLR